MGKILDYFVFSDMWLGLAGKFLREGCEGGACPWQAEAQRSPQQPDPAKMKIDDGGRFDAGARPDDPVDII